MKTNYKRIYNFKELSLGLFAEIGLVTVISVIGLLICFLMY